MTFRLDAVGLTVEVKERIRARKGCPWACWHPYFNLPLSADSSRDVSSASARQQVLGTVTGSGSRSDGQTPSVSGKMDLRAGLVIGDNFYDDMFTDVERIPTADLCFTDR